MSMLFGGDRDFIGEIGGMRYYRRSGGEIYCDDGYSLDLVSGVPESAESQNRAKKMRRDAKEYEEKLERVWKFLKEVNP